MIMKKDFFASLFEYSAGAIEIRCLPNNKQRFFHTQNEEQLIEFIENNLDQNVYFAVSTRNCGGKKEHIVNIPACWVDLDNTSIQMVEEKLRGFFS